MVMGRPGGFSAELLNPSLSASSYVHKPLIFSNAWRLKTAVVSLLGGTRPSVSSTSSCYETDYMYKHCNSIRYYLTCKYVHVHVHV